MKTQSNILKRNVLTRWFTSTVKIFSFAKRKNLLQQDAAKAQLLPTTYYDLDSLKLTNFIKIYDTNQLNLLLKSGEATETDLKEYWQELLFDYFTAIGSSQSVLNFKLNKNIVKLQYKISILTISFNIYLNTRDLKIEKELKKIGFAFDNKATDEQLYNYFIANKKLLEIELAKMESDLENVNKSDNTGKKVTGDVFTSNLITLSKHNGYRVDPDVVSVRWYCVLLSQFNDYLKQTANNAKY